MKKFLVLILAIIMVLSVVACKNEPEKGGDALPVEKEAGQDALIEQGSSAKALDHTGFKIVVTTTEGKESTSFEIGGRNDIYWVNLGTEAMFVCEHSGSTYYYLDLEGLGSGFWIKIADKSLKEEIFGTMVDTLLYNAYEYKDYLAYVATETKHGRPCSKYTVSAKEEGVNYSFSIWVDQEFGITMGMEVTAGEDAFNYTINPKLSGLTDSDAPAGYATAKACTNFYDSIPM